MLGTDLNNLAEELATATGLNVVLDQRDLVLPGVLVTPGEITFDRLDAHVASAALELWLVAGDSNPVTALDELTHMLLTLRKHYGDAPTTAEPMTLTVSTYSPDPMPAFRCPIPIEIVLQETTP